jgi:hypothetical protein
MNNDDILELCERIAYQWDNHGRFRYSDEEMDLYGVPDEVKLAKFIIDNKEKLS